MSMTKAPRLLLADIGGTNARFAVTDERGALAQVQVFPTASLSDVAGLAALVAQHFDLAVLDAASVALAGPVQAGAGRITNGTLSLEADALAAQLRMPVVLLNDFFALAHGLAGFEQLQTLGGEASLPDQSRALLGPGTGLGMSVCVPDAGQTDGWRVLPSEGGYGDLAAGSPLEAEVLALLQEQVRHVCWETVLSGPGLVLLYRTLAQIWGDAQAAHDSDVTAAWITEQAHEARVPLCHQTLELFFGWLGAAAGNLALTSYALGGVYIAGGIVPRLAQAAADSPLRRRFEERGALSPLVARIPLHIVMDEYPGLRGAACAGRKQWASGELTAGR